MTSTGDELASVMHPLLKTETINLFKRGQIFTMHQFLQHDALMLSKMSKLSYKAICAVKEHILKSNSAPVRNGLEFYHATVERTVVISTNHPNLDTILCGGFYTGNIYELCAQSAHISTRFINKFVIDFLLKFKSCQTVLYYDTKFAFNPMLLKYICDKELGLGKDIDILDYLIIAQIKDINQLYEGLCELRQHLKDLHVQVIVINSLTTLLHSTIRIEKQNMLLNSLITILREIAAEYHVCFIVANMLRTDQKNLLQPGHAQVYGGKYWASLSNVVLRIVIGDDDDYDFCLLKNNLGPLDRGGILRA